MKIFLDFMKFYTKENFEIFTDYFNLINDIEFAGTPDTLARMYSLANKNEELERLKSFLSCFLLFEQLKKGQLWQDYLSETNDKQKRVRYGKDLINSLTTILDRRYLSLLGVLLSIGKFGSNDIIVPDNLSIISWNYDSQLESAFQEIFKWNVRSAKEKLRFLPSGYDYINDDDFYLNQFTVMKINGTAAFRKSDNKDLFDFHSHSLDSESLGIITNILFKKYSEYSNSMYFAWDLKHHSVPENSMIGYIIKSRKIANEKLKLADIVVIIGYSFPDFNRQIDKEIFTGANNIKRVYLQDPNAENIKQKIQGVAPQLKDRIEVITETSNFTIPFEFWE